MTDRPFRLGCRFLLDERGEARCSTCGRSYRDALDAGCGRTDPGPIARRRVGAVAAVFALVRTLLGRSRWSL